MCKNIMHVMWGLCCAVALGMSGCGNDGGMSGPAKASSKVVFAAADTTTKSRVYMGADGDKFTISNSGATVYGGSGYDTVTIATGVAGVSLDQNVEQVNFPDTLSRYAFKQTGNKINVYDFVGSTLLVTMPVQSGGTLLTFSDRSASALLNGGVMALGGVTVSSSTATTLVIPVLPTPTPTVSVQVVACPSAGATNVTIQDFSFAPANVSIAVNGIVKWTNSGLSTHIVASGNSPSFDNQFNSGNLTTGGTFCTQFSAAGTYPYFCAIHPFMSGSVTVQ